MLCVATIDQTALNAVVDIIASPLDNTFVHPLDITLHYSTIMTDLLRQLYRNFGYLAALLTNINELHDTWASSSRRRHDSTADKLLTHNAPVAFVSAYYEWRVPGQDNSTEQIYGMCLVQAQSYFEGYLAELLRKMLRATPRMLLQNFDHDKRSTDHRNLDYRTIISAVECNESVIELMVVQRESGDEQTYICPITITKEAFRICRFDRGI